MDKFINKSISDLDDIDEDQWQHIQQGLASQLQEKDQNLRIKSQRFWAAICNKDDEFKHKENLLHAVLTLTLAQVKTFIKERLDNTCKPDRFILYSQSESLDQVQRPSGEIVTDIDTFITSSKIKY